VIVIEEPVVAVHIPPPLRPYTQGRDEIMASGDTVRDVLESLEHEHPGVLSRVVSLSGGVDPGLEIWLGGTNIASLAGLATPIGLEEVVSIVSAGTVAPRRVTQPVG
jgi:sulfur-carrier protein